MSDLMQLETELLFLKSRLATVSPAEVVDLKQHIREIEEEICWIKREQEIEVSYS